MVNNAAVVIAVVRSSGRNFMSAYSLLSTTNLNNRMSGGNCARSLQTVQCPTDRMQLLFHLQHSRSFFASTAACVRFNGESRAAMFASVKKLHASIVSARCAVSVLRTLLVLFDEGGMLKAKRNGPG